MFMRCEKIAPYPIEEVENPFVSTVSVTIFVRWEKITKKS